VPPLRQRGTDISQIAMFFLARFSKKFGKKIQGMPRATVDRLMSYSWPGNIRELQNVVERGVILSQSSVLELEADVIPALMPADSSIMDDQSNVVECILPPAVLLPLLWKKLSAVILSLCSIKRGASSKGRVAQQKF